jgi:hypothetical protein
VALPVLSGLAAPNARWHTTRRGVSAYRRAPD